MSTLYSNPKVPILQNPINLDNEIQDIQLKLATLPWLEKSFGRAWAGIELRDGKPYYYPEVYQGKKEYLNVLPNDHLKSQSFISVKNESCKAPDYYSFQSNVYNYILDIIIWFNLERIDNTKTYRFNEELKKDVLDIIRPHTPLKILNIYEDSSDVFNAYSIDHIKWQTFKHPFGGFRFECDLNFTEIC